jgi:subtilisin family serine protease
MNHLSNSVHKHIVEPIYQLRGKPPVKIALLTTGVDLKHPFIKGAMKAKNLKFVQSFVKGDENVDDWNGIGTHLAALSTNVAPQAQLFVAKICTGSDIPLDHKIAEVSPSLQENPNSRPLQQ